MTVRQAIAQLSTFPPELELLTLWPMLMRGSEYTPPQYVRREMAEPGEKPLPDVIVILPRDEPMCRKCGCMNDDCAQCVERTGESCHWVAPNLCSACAPTPRKRRKAKSK